MPEAGALCSVTYSCPVTYGDCFPYFTEVESEDWTDGATCSGHIE